MEGCDGLSRGCGHVYSEKPDEKTKYTYNGMEYISEWAARNAKELLEVYGIELCTREEVEGFTFPPNHPYFNRTVTILDLEFESGSENQCETKSRDPSPKGRKRKAKQKTPRAIEDDFAQIREFAKQNAKLAKDVSTKLSQNSPKQRVIKFLDEKVERLVQEFPDTLAIMILTEKVDDRLYIDTFQSNFVEKIRKANEALISKYISKRVKVEKGYKKNGLGREDVKKLQEEYKLKFITDLTEDRRIEWEAHFDIGLISEEIDQDFVDKEEVLRLFAEAQKRKFIYEHKYPELEDLISHSKKVFSQLVRSLFVARKRVTPGIILSCITESFGISSQKVRETFNELNLQGSNNISSKHSRNVLIQLFTLLEIYHIKKCGLELSEAMKELEADFEKRKKERLEREGANKIDYEMPEINFDFTPPVSERIDSEFANQEFLNKNFAASTIYEKGVVLEIYKKYLVGLKKGIFSSVEAMESCLLSEWERIRKALDHAEKVGILTAMLGSNEADTAKIAICSQYNFLNDETRVFHDEMCIAAYRVIYGEEADSDEGLDIVD